MHYRPTLAAANLAAIIARHAEFSFRTFGPGERVAGTLDHIREELEEIEADPSDAEEWVDVILLALQGAIRQGHPPAAVAAAILGKMDKNDARDWPDWRTADPDKAIKHVKRGDLIPTHDPRAIGARCFSTNIGE